MQMIFSKAMFGLGVHWTFFTKQHQYIQAHGALFVTLNGMQLFINKL
jgi:hypothetical protein